MTVASIDFETYGTVELKRTGVYPYAKHHDTGIWCMAYAFEAEEPELWHPGLPFPERLLDHVAEGNEVRAWNASFERIMWRDCARLKYGFPAGRDDQFVCTMAEAQAMALPRALAHAAQVLRVDTKKDMDGKKLSLQMCRPRRFDEDGNPIWWNDAPRLARLFDYCKQDVRTERAVAGMTRRLNARERAIYLHSQLMNDRGVQVDMTLVMAARQVAQQEIDRQNAILSEATDGAVGEVTKVQKLKEWLATQGLVDEKGKPLASLDKAALRELLSDSSKLTEPVLIALQTRQEAAKSSVKKLDAMLDCADRDNKMRGLLMYHAASTGRWAGMLAQPHNFPRGNDVKQPEQYIPRVLKLEPLSLNILSAMLRSMLTASPGGELLCSDFASIEARVLAWLAEQDDLVAAFAADAPIYKHMAAKVYKCSWQDIVKPSDQYTLGKSLILGCGFQMGAQKFVDSSKDQYGLVVEPELAAEAVSTYRATYPKIVSYWYEVNKCAIDAVANPGTIFVARGRVKFVKRGGYLWITLPAGRSLAYASPKVVDRPVPWDKTGKETRPAVEFSGINGYTRKWERMALYGGSITENIVQAVARDLLADAMLRVEDAGYPVILSVHDEILTDLPAKSQAKTEYDGVLCDATLNHFTNLMKRVPEWAAGCPVNCESWQGFRYRK